MAARLGCGKNLNNAMNLRLGDYIEITSKYVI